MTETLNNPAIMAAQNYEKNFVPYLMTPTAVLLLDVANPTVGEHIIDIACGTGAVTRLMAPIVGASGKVVAVDINPAMLEVGRTSMPNGNPPIEWREGSALELPLPDSSFDLVTCAHGLQYFTDAQRALQEMRRVLRPSGRAAIAVWGPLSDSSFYQVLWETVARHLNSSTSNLARAFKYGDTTELYQMIVEAGFQQIQIDTHKMTIVQPWNEHIIDDTLAAATATLPEFKDMSAEKRSEMAGKIDVEIGSEIRSYVQGDSLFIPATVNIALAKV